MAVVLGPCQSCSCGLGEPAGERLCKPSSDGVCLAGGISLPFRHEGVARAVEEAHCYEVK
jgi:hypothetical protein